MKIKLPTVGRRFVAFGNQPFTVVSVIRLRGDRFEITYDYDEDRLGSRFVSPAQFWEFVERECKEL